MRVTRFAISICVRFTRNFCSLYEPYFLKSSGGLKWTRTIDVIAYARSFLPIFLAPSNLRYFGGLKWTRTIDLTLIRRVL